MPGSYSGIALPPVETPAVKRRYSVTTDIVGYRRCGRQYGAFHVHDFTPAHQTQLYFGTIIHQVLDRCHAHFQGIPDMHTAGTIPDGGTVLPNAAIESYFDDLRTAARARAPSAPPPSQMVRYFIEVEDGLKSRGIRAITPDLRLKAIRILQYFNALEGPDLYPRVVDTEHRLQADQGNHIIHGVVDLLANTSRGAAAPSDREMWDYKGTSRITLTRADLLTYQFQMRVYAKLYELKHGVFPQQAILYFLNELDGPTPPSVRPVNAILSVSLATADVDAAVDEFRRTVGDIEAARLADVWSPAGPGMISDQDCAICDLRWDCPTPNGGTGVTLRYP